MAETHNSWTILKAPPPLVKCRYCGQTFPKIRSRTQHEKRYCKARFKKEKIPLPKFCTTPSKKLPGQPIRKKMIPCSGSRPSTRGRKGRLGGSYKGDTKRSYSITWKLQRVLEFERLPNGSKKNFLRRHHIWKSSMSTWRKKKDKWMSMTWKERNFRRKHRRRNQGKGLFHHQEEKLFQMFLDRRGKGMPVSYNWLIAKMHILIRIDKPPHFDPEKHKLKKSWAFRFCKRFKLSRRRRTNRKKKDLFERLHLIRNYHWWTVYEFSKRSNYPEKYWNKENLPEIPSESESEESDNTEESSDSESDESCKDESNAEESDSTSSESSQTDDESASDIEDPRLSIIHSSTEESYSQSTSESD